MSRASAARQPIRITVTALVRMTGPGHPASRQARIRMAASRSSAGCRARNLASANSARQSWTMMITQ
jgi:hypothetical protein